MRLLGINVGMEIMHKMFLLDILGQGFRGFLHISNENIFVYVNKGNNGWLYMMRLN